MKKIKIGVRDFIGLIISVFFLLLTFRNFTFDPNLIKWNVEIIVFISIAFLLTTLPTYFNAIRFRLFFKDKPDEYKRVRPFPSFFIGHFYNAVLPGNIGEAVKIYHLSKKYNLHYKNVLVYWICEKYLDAIVLPLIIIPPLLMLHDTYMKFILSVLLFIIFIAVLYVFLSQRIVWVKKIPFRLIPVKKIRKYLYALFLRFISVYEKFYRDKRIYTFLGISLMFYAVFLTFNYFIILASDLPAIFLSFQSLMLLATVALVVHFVPSAPSSAGVAHYGIYSSLVILATHYHIEVDDLLKNKLVIASTIFHFILFASDVIIGSYFIYRERKWLFERKKS